MLFRSAPGYKHILISPHPGGGLTEVRAELNSVHGKIVSAWKLDGANFSLSVIVPPNTSATVCLPGATLVQISDVDACQDGDTVVVEVGSGQYEFSYNRE